MKFEAWMESSGLSQSSIEKYAGAIDGPLTDWALIHKIIASPLRTISNPQQFALVSAKIAATPEYEIRNQRGHHMYGAALKKFADFLSSAPNAETKAEDAEGPHTQQLKEIEAEENPQSFTPKGLEDARETVLREVVRRRGQPKFRSNLINAYEGRCAITGCTVLPILEAAHITPYLGPSTNAVDNGILLRADIHTLWDLGLIAIEPTSKAVWVSPSVTDNTYQALSGTTAFEPQELGSRPSIMALQQQWSIAQNGAIAS